MAAEREDGRSMAPMARNSGHGRQLEKEALRFWIDLEMTSAPEIGMVV